MIGFVLTEGVSTASEAVGRVAQPFALFAKAGVVCSSFSIKIAGALVPAGANRICAFVTRLKPVPFPKLSEEIRRTLRWQEVQRSFVGGRSLSRAAPLPQDDNTVDWLRAAAWVGLMALLILRRKDSGTRNCFLGEISGPYIWGKEKCTPGSLGRQGS
jgi:hypothetical protein